MRFPRRAEVGLDTEVESRAIILEPDAGAARERRRPRGFAEAEQPGVEHTRPRLAALRHSQLYVVNPNYGHGGAEVSTSRARSRRDVRQDSRTSGRTR